MFICRCMHQYFCGFYLGYNFTAGMCRKNTQVVSCGEYMNCIWVSEWLISQLTFFIGYIIGVKNPHLEYRTGFQRNKHGDTTDRVVNGK